MTAALPTKRLILLVDDDALVLSVVSHILRAADYEIIECRAGDEGLAAARERKPDLALIDIEMPGMSGIELARHLHTESITEFMFISAHGEDEILDQVREYGAVGYLRKPFDVSQVMPAFETALALADEIRRLRRNEGHLTDALQAARETSMAIGLLMRVLGADRDTAFAVLRDHARSGRRKVNEVATELLAAEELFNSFKSAYARRPQA
ncbi:MAG: response regulator [Pseudomonadota bacterium]